MAGREPYGWWQRHGTTVFLLSVAALVAFLIRTLYAYQLIGQCNISYCFAGGSDSFYHSRVTTWIIQNHTNLVHDPLLNYPFGSVNPREPLFDWMNAILGMIFAPLFGGDAVLAGMWFLEMQPPFWAAMGVFPVYMIGKEVSSRRMGLIAALIYPLFVGSIESTVATYANYLSFYSFFVFLTLAVYIHAIKLSGTRRWVENYASPRSIWNGAKNFIRVERDSFHWAIFSGVAFGATMLAWQGYTYVVAIIVVFLTVTLLVERIRRHDTFGAYVVTFIVGTIGFLMAMPYYYAQGDFITWFGLPMIIFFGALLALLPFMMLRDTPWLTSLLVMIASIGGAAGGLYLYSKADFQSVITGQGYFVKTLIYSTVAEAQAPSFDSLIVSYGVITFFIAFIGLAIFILHLYRFKFRREHTFMVILGLVGIYLPVSAAKFFLIGTPLFALLSAEVLLVALDRMGYSEMRHTMASLSGSGGTWFAFKKSFKVRHLLILVIAFGVIFPNVWYAVDAGIPGNVKSNYESQIYNTLPAEFRSSLGPQAYLGAAGIDTDTPTQYDENGYNWLATQDTNLIPQNRPAFVSWWDYGFQALDEGRHPTVADNFQDGIVPSGHFLLAQNESQAIAVLATTLLYAEQQETRQPYLPASLNALLKADGLNLSVLHNYLVNTTQDIQTVINNPQLYGPVDTTNIEGTGGAENALFFTVAQYISSALNENGVVKVYQDIQSYTGWSIGYAMSDIRLFPTSGSNTGIYYAPVDLTDGEISAGGIPSYYFTVNVTGSDGNTYPLGSVPPGVQAVSASITYNAAFYRSMIYHIIAGYNGTQIGSSQFIPGVGSPGGGSTGQSSPLDPGWMMQHFMMEYETSYYCPSKNVTSGCFNPVNYPQALAYQKAGTGTAYTPTGSSGDGSVYMSSGGETILRYYPGANVSGYVALPNGQPLRGVNITVMDQWGIPHMVAETNQYGAFNLIAPPGNDSLVVSYGTASGLQQTGTVIDTMNVTVSPGLALVYGSPGLFVPIKIHPGSVSGRVFWNVANSTSFNPRDVVIPGATVSLVDSTGYQVNVTTDATGTYLASNLPPGSYTVSVSIAAHSEFSAPSFTLSNGEVKTQEIPIAVSKIHGTVYSDKGGVLSNAVITLSSPSYPTQTTNSSFTGTYNFTMLLPGNYTARASAADGATSGPSTVSLLTEGKNVSLNFTVGNPTIASFTFLYNHLPVPNLPVRFTPLGTQGNTTVLVYTAANGVATARLEPGIWGIYALGALNGTYVSSLSNLDIINGTSSLVESFDLKQAVSLSGTISSSTTGAPQNGVFLSLRASNGAVLDAASNASGEYRLFLPPDTYTVLATYTASGTSPTYAAAGTIGLGTPATLDLTLSNAVSYSPLIGYPTASGDFVPLPDSVVTVGFGGNTLMGVSNATGYAKIILPQVSSAFSVSATHYGFSLGTTLTYASENALLAAMKLSLKAVPISVTMDVSCSGCSVAPVVNFTAVAPPANSTQITATLVNGTYEVRGQLSPGPYTVSAVTQGSGSYWAQVGTVAAYVPVGAGPLTLPSITLFQQQTYNGSLKFPITTVNTTLAASAQVNFYSPGIGNFSLAGKNFTNASSPFHAPPGSYTAWVVAYNGSKVYAFLGNVTLGQSGGALPTLHLQPARNVTLTFSSTYGHTQNVPVTALLRDTSSSAYGATIPVSATSAGATNVILPNGTYAISVNSTDLVNVSGVLHYTTFVTQPNPTYCTVNATLTTCSVSLHTISSFTTVSGSMYLGSQLSLASGRVFFEPVGGNATQTTTVPIANGHFFAALLPGTYTVYAEENVGGFWDVNFSTVVLPYEANGNVLSLQLEPGWQNTVSFVLPGGVTVPSSVVLNVTRNGTSQGVYFADIPTTSPYALYLPSGDWHLVASTTSQFHGSNVTLQANATIIGEGSNSAFSLNLAPQWVLSTSMTITGSQTVNTQENGNVSVSFVVKNTGNSLEVLHFQGAPVTWNYSFYPANVSLLPGASASVDSLIHITNGTLVTTNSATLEALLPNSVKASASASVTINIAPVHAITLKSTPSSSIVGNHTVQISFSVAASGNSVEDVTVSVLNGAELNQSGWAWVVNGGFTGLTPDNPATTGTVVLTSFLAGASPPNSITLLAIDKSAPGLTKTLTISVPVATLTVPGPLLVTGPNIGTPTPDYMTYLTILATVAPAVAIVAYTLGRRWWKTRRWVRR
jgi:dolichyl-diphosphooligosaccharide--protein glycosyltransferase